MATRRFDELTAISKELGRAGLTKQIREYFDGMDIPDNDKRNRTNTAYGFFAVFTALFSLINADIEEYGYITETQKTAYCEKCEADFRDVLERNDYGEYLDELWDKISLTVSKIVDETLSNDSEYYTSAERAVVIAETETNKVGNLKVEREAVKEGFTRKVWVTEKDDKVRHTHRLVDETEIGIYDTFQVGMYQMAFPCDESYGAGAGEIVNCRCACKYL